MKIMKINFEQCYEGGTTWTARAQAWAMSNELIDNGDGTYTLPETLPQGSEVIVIDSPGKLLFVGDDGLAYDWTASE